MRRSNLFVSSSALLMAGVLISPAGAATLYDDTFADGVRGRQWTSVIDDPTRLTLAEQGGRLDLISTGGGSPNNDALYLSNFRLSTAENFRVRIDYSFTAYSAGGTADGAVGLVFGVGRDADGTDSAAIGQGYGTRFVNFGGASIPVTAAAGTSGYRTDDVPFGGSPDLSNPTTGTFEIRYDAGGDDLVLERVGGGVSLTLNDTVRGVWAADSLLVSFGGRGDQVSTTAGQAFLDNFRIDFGTVVPEPSGLAAVCLFGVAVGRRRRGIVSVGGGRV